MDFEEIIKFFNENHDENNLKTMKRLKAGSSKTYGIKMPVLRKLAKDIELIINYQSNYGIMDIMIHGYLLH